MTSHDTELSVEIVGRFLSLGDLSTASIRRLRRHYSRLLADESPRSVFDLALILLTKTKVPRFFVFELIQHHPAASRSLNYRKLKQLGAGMDSWGEVDAFACYLSGPAWRNRQISDSSIESWTRSNNRWWRRVAVVSTVALNNKTRGGSGDLDRTLRICELVVNDKDDMVVKALSWALRELSKREPTSVARFIEEQKGKLSPRVVREVTNKLRTGLKNPKRQMQESVR